MDLNPYRWSNFWAETFLIALGFLLLSNLTQASLHLILVTPEGRYLTVLLSVAVLYPLLWVIWRRHPDIRPHSLLEQKYELVYAIGLGFIVFFLNEALFYMLTQPYTPLLERAEMTRWLFWLPSCLVAIFLQSSAEEYLFRGYLYDSLSRLGVKKYTLYLFPTLLWTLIHYNNLDDPRFVPSFLVMVFCLGLVLMHMRARTGGLGASIGLHVGLNVFTELFYGNNLRPTPTQLWQWDYETLPSWIGSLYFLSFAVILFGVYATKMIALRSSTS